MPSILDLECGKCGKVETNHFFPQSSLIDQSMPKCCGKDMEIRWSEVRSVHLPVHSSEAIAIWENPRTGDIRYPGRNDAPIPEKYRQQGYIRKEIRNLSEVHKFEKQHHVTSEIANFDRGTGRGLEDYERRSRFR